MRIVGLTGGIGSGKSTVSKYLKDKGCCIIDADEISRQMTAKDGEALDGIRTVFGSNFFFENGELDRKKLGAYVFGNQEKKLILEEIITKRVIEKCNSEIESLKTDESHRYILGVLDAPLLFEFDLQHVCDETWLVTCDMDVRIKRIMERDGLSEEEIIGRIQNQMSEQDKIKIADCIIDNSRDLPWLHDQLDELLQKIIKC